MKNNDYDEMLSQVTEAIGKFLKKEGGMGNGYLTYANGTVSHNSHQSIKFYTPKTDDLTGHELNKKGSELNDKLIKILKAYDYIDDVEIESTHMEHGCYNIEVSLKITSIARVSFL